MPRVAANINIAPDKLPPQNIDAEKSILGSIIIDKDSLNKVVDFLNPDDFYYPAHRIIYSNILDLFEKHEPIDLLSLSNRLGETGHLNEAGGVSYLTSLASSVPTSSHISTYGKIVQRKKMLRDLIGAAHHISSLGHNEEDEIEHLLDEAEQKIFAVAQRSLTHAFSHIGSGLSDAMERITNQDTGVLRGMPTKHKYLDNLLGGFQRSDLVILAARPSVGKTSFAIDIALRMAEQGVATGLFSMEMSIDQVVDRFIANKAGVSMWKLRTGKLSHDDDDFLRITTACDQLKDLPIFVDDSSSPNILQMKAMARRLQANQKLGLLIVDYLQLMSAKRSYDSPVQQVTEISRGLKGLAKELNIPIIALSQLSRAVEQREGHKPKLSDLRDSGSIEQDADVVLFIHRDDKNNYERAKEQNKLNQAQIVIAKHRNGPTGEVDFRIDPDSLRFLEIDKSRQEEILTF
jgi:replicative DNA helicase